MTDKYIKKTQGFTLVELSIVIIIIGFLIAGIAAGQSLIKQAKLNSLIDEITEINTAVNTFKMTYGYLPGDFPNAESYWPSETCISWGNVLSCNGDGSDVIGYPEYVFAWDHLNESKIMLSTFHEDPNPTGYKLLKYGDSTIGVIYAWTDIYYGNDLRYTNVLNIYSYTNWPNGFAPADLSNIDIKMDDGNPSSGRFMADGPASPGCTVEADGVTLIDYFDSYPYNDAKYALSKNNLGCTEILYTLD